MRRTGALILKLGKLCQEGGRMMTVVGLSRNANVDCRRCVEGGLRNVVVDVGSLSWLKCSRESFLEAG